MSRRIISNEQRDKCWRLWCEQQSVNYVAIKGGVTRATIGRLRKKDNWDERLARIKEEAQIIADAKSVKRLAQNLQILKFAKAEIANGLKNGTIKGNVSDLVQIIKTEELLLGNPDSRVVETPTAPIDPNELEKEIIELGELCGYEIRPKGKFNGRPKNHISSTLAGKELSL